MKKTYFTIEPTIAGFTDQLVQFNAFYKLGLSLGFHYIHTPFSSERSNAHYLLVGDVPKDTSTGNRIGKWLRAAVKWNGPVEEDVFDFLGINRYFEASRQPDSGEGRNFRARTIGLSDNYLLEWNIDCFESLAAHLGNLAKQAANDPEAGSDGAILINFRLEGPRRNCFSLIQAKFPRFQDGLNLPEIYAQARARAPIKSLYRKGRLKILLHIRQGDTGVVKTPWGTCLPVWSLRQDQLKEYESFDRIESAQLLFEVAEYKTFLDEFLKRLDRSARSILVFSDGANRSLRIVERNLGKLGWSPEQIQDFRASKADYDQRQFSCFSGDGDVRLVVGEEPLKLRQLIDSAIESDIVIVSNQLRMIPKLVANYCDEKSPKVIVLYKRDAPVNSDIVSDDGNRFIYVDVENPDYEALIRRIRE